MAMAVLNNRVKTCFFPGDSTAPSAMGALATVKKSVDYARLVWLIVSLVLIGLGWWLGMRSAR